MSEELELQGENVVRSKRERKYPIENAVRHIEQGRREGNGTKFTTHFDLAPGEGPKVYRTLAYNPDTDERLVEVGTLSEEGKRMLAEDETKAAKGRSSATTILRAEGQA